MAPSPQLNLLGHPHGSPTPLIPGKQSRRVNDPNGTPARLVRLVSLRTECGDITSFWGWKGPHGPHSAHYTFQSRNPAAGPRASSPPTQPLSHHTGSSMSPEGPPSCHPYKSVSSGYRPWEGIPRGQWLRMLKGTVPQRGLPHNTPSGWSSSSWYK